MEYHLLKFKSALINLLTRFVPDVFYQDRYRSLLVKFINLKEVRVHN